MRLTSLAMVERGALDREGMAPALREAIHAMGAGLYPGVPIDRPAALRRFDQASVAGWTVSRYMSCALRRPSAGRTAAARLDCHDRVAETGRPGQR